MPDIENDVKDVDDKEPRLAPEEARKYRAIAARLNYLAPDRVDIQCAVTEAARSMSSPTAKDWPKLQRIGWHLFGRPRMSIDFPWQNGQSMATAYTDSSWVGCARSARGTSGGIISIGDHMLKPTANSRR